MEGNYCHLSLSRRDGSRIIYNRHPHPLDGTRIKSVVHSFYRTFRLPSRPRKDPDLMGADYGLPRRPLSHFGSGDQMEVHVCLPESSNFMGGPWIYHPLHLYRPWTAYPRKVSFPF